MIKVITSKDKIIIKGHANYDDLGKDIVCSSVSTLVTTTINAILKFDDKAIMYKQEKDELIITVLKNNNETKVLLDNMMSLLSELEENYSKNIKICKGE